MDGGGILAAVVCMPLAFFIFPVLLWRRRSDAATANHRLPPQPLQERVVRGGAAARHMRRRPAATSSSATSTSRDDAEDDAESERRRSRRITMPPKSPRRRRRKGKSETSSLRIEYGTEVHFICLIYMPQVTIATAIVFCHRFFLRQSHAKNDRRTITTVCMFLAGKVEETPRPLKDVILISYEIIHKRDPGTVQRIKQKKQKCVPLEDLAAEFRMRAQDCINRIITLEGMGQQDKLIVLHIDSRTVMDNKDERARLCQISCIII